MKFKLLLVISLIIFDNLVESCTSFYCINSCGKSSEKNQKGFKLILANNRDEDIYRPTIPAGVWPAKTLNTKTYFSIDNKFVCDQSKANEPFNLCVYGALDEANGIAPNYYSTWLGINERGSVGNLLFFMGKSSRPGITPRGVIVGNYIQNSSWPNVESYMEYLNEHKLDYKPFNYVQLEMSQTTGSYSLYYINNNNTSSYEKMNKDDINPFVFGVSNSDPARSFQKVLNGQMQFEQIINEYILDSDKNKLIDSMVMNLMMNTSANYPDKTLAAFMGLDTEKYSDIIKGVSQINANYSNYWVNGHTRTCTLILVDYDDNVEYYEYNLTNIDSKSWKMNSFEFKLKPLYKNFSNKIDLNYFCFLAILFLKSF